MKWHFEKVIMDYIVNIIYLICDAYFPCTISNKDVIIDIHIFAKKFECNIAEKRDGFLEHFFSNSH